VAGVVAPFVMHSMLGLALASAGALGVGLAAWLWVKPRLDPSAGLGS
jgi:DHA1 family bicyclomycin/chloramphenicol resistance-like MFS transporter